MRRWLAVLIVAVTALSLAGVVGQASGQAAQATQRSITVNGSASRTLKSDATDADIRAAYRAALSDALVAARAKADFVATSESVMLGALNNITEQTDAYPGGCGYAVSNSGGLARPLAPSSASTPPQAVSKQRRHRAPKHPVKRAQDTPPSSCPVGAAVTVTYLIA